MAVMGGGVEARPEAPGLALQGMSNDNPTTLPPASDLRVRFTGNSLSEGYVPSRQQMEQAKRWYEERGLPFDPMPEDAQAPLSKETSQATMETHQREQDKGKDPLSSNGEKIDPLQSL